MKIKTAQKLSFECSHSGVSSTDLKLKLKTWNLEPFLQPNKLILMKLMLNSFDFNVFSQDVRVEGVTSV